MGSIIGHTHIQNNLHIEVRMSSLRELANGPWRSDQNLLTLTGNSFSMRSCSNRVRTVMLLRGQDKTRFTLVGDVCCIFNITLAT